MDDGLLQNNGQGVGRLPNYRRGVWMLFAGLQTRSIDSVYPNYKQGVWTVPTKRRQGVQTQCWATVMDCYSQGVWMVFTKLVLRYQ